MNYFSRLFRHSKILFAGISLFCAFTLIANMLKIETTPFFVWGMYSEKEQTPASYPILEVMVNDSIRVDYSRISTDANRFYLLSPLTYFWDIRAHGGVDPQEIFLDRKTAGRFHFIQPVKNNLFNDSSDQTAFQHWYCQYLEESIHRRVDKVTVNVLELTYGNAGRPELKNRYSLASWKK